MAYTDQSAYFRTIYPALTGHPEPFFWQVDLFRRMCDSEIPSEAVLPTGCGKTSAMAIWLLALAWQARNGPQNLSLPRRLVWVVNRRVVVDQATREAEEIRARLNDQSLPVVAPVREALRSLSGGDGLIGVSTLRGQFADNAEWRANPARPAIIVSVRPNPSLTSSGFLFPGEIGQLDSSRAGCGYRRLATELGVSQTKYRLERFQRARAAQAAGVRPASF